MKNILNDLSNKEWMKFTRSWGLSDPHSMDKWAKKHPATFNPYDIQKIIEFFTKKGGKVLDPFGGVGSTLVACALSGRRGTQIELYPRHHWTALARLYALFGVKGLNTQKSLLGNATEWLQILEGKKFDLVITSPPYWNMMKRGSENQSSRKKYEIPRKYGDSELDLGNAREYWQFMSSFYEIMSLCNPLLEDKGHVIVIVRDFRIGKRYHPFHIDIMHRLEKAGFIAKGVKILCHENMTLRPFGLGNVFVPNVHHDYILIHQKEKDVDKIICDANLRGIYLD